ncbi:MAG: Ig-like domain-containing protein, partial [Microcoleus sp.]
ADLAQGTDYYVEIASGAIKDLAGNNYAGTTGATAWNFTTAVAVDTTAPTATLATTAAATVNAGFNVSATFSETVNGFDTSDINVTNGSVSDFIGTGSNYNFNVTPKASGAVTVNLPASAATDAAGNNNTAATALTRTFSATFSVWSEIDTYLKNNGINVSDPVKEALQQVVNTIKPLTFEIQGSKITATYNATGSLNNVLKALGVPVANGSVILNGDIANPSLAIDTSKSSPAYELSGNISGQAVTFGYQKGQAVTATYTGNVSLADLLKTVGVTDTAGSAILTGSITAPSLKIDTSKSPSAYEFTGNISGQAVTFGYQKGQAVTATYTGNVSLADLLKTVGVTDTAGSAILTGSITAPSLKIDTSKSSPAYEFTGNISGQTVTFGYQKGQAVTAKYTGDVSLADLLKTVGVSATDGSSILTGSITNPSIKIDTSKSSPAYEFTGNISGKTVTFGYQKGQAVTATYTGNVSLADLLKTVGVSATDGSSILTGSITNPSIKIDTSKSPSAYEFTGNISGQTVTFGYQKGQAVTVSYQGDVSLANLLNQVGFNSGGIASDILNSSVKNPSIKIDTSKPTAVYELTGVIDGQSLSFSVSKNTIKIGYPKEASLTDLVKKIPVDGIKTFADKITPPLSSPSFTIDKSSGSPKYIASGKLNFKVDDGQNNFFDFINKKLGIENVSLDAEFNSSGASVKAGLGTDITLFKTGDFSGILKGLNLNGSLQKGQPSFGIGGNLILKGYDPFQNNEPDLTLSGNIAFDPTSLTGSFALDASNSWKKPFGINDAKISSLGFQLGGTYVTPWVDNVGFRGDLQFGDLALNTAFLVDVTNPDKFALELTAKQPVSLVALWAGGPIGSYALKQFGQKSNFFQKAETFLKDTLDVKIVSIDGPDADKELDPLVKMVPFPTKIAGKELTQGLGINGQVEAWGKKATLSLNANPYDPSNPSLEGVLQIPEIDLGFLKLTGADGPNDKTVDLALKVSPTEQYLKGDGKLEIFGHTVAKANVEFTSTSFKVKDFDLNYGVVALDINDFSVDIAKKTASGSGSLEIFGKKIAGAKINADSNGLKVEGNIDLGILSIDRAIVEIKSPTDIKIQGKLKLFGEELPNNGDVGLSKDGLSLNTKLGYNILGKNIGVGIDIRLGRSNKIELTANVPGIGTPSWSIDLNKAPDFSSISDWLEDLVVGPILKGVNEAIKVLKDGWNVVSKGVIAGWNGVEEFFKNLSSSIENGYMDIANFVAKVTGGELSGNDSNNEINGTWERNNIFGQGGNDKLLGQAGDDYIYGGTGEDIIYGGSEDDRLYGESDNDLLYGERGNDYLYGGSGRDLLAGGDGFDRLEGEDGNDLLYGGALYDELFGGWGNDQLHGEAGNDRLEGQQGDDLLHGGAGNDKLWGGSVADWEYRTSLSYVVIQKGTDTSNDHLYGDEGEDYLYGEGGDDLLNGGSENDYLYGGGDKDKLLGENGNDDLRGDGGDDELYGSHGQDTLYGGTENDYLYGQQGHDLLNGEDGNDTLFGDDEVTTTQENGVTKVVPSSYDGSYDNDSLYGGGGNDYLFGGTGNDYLDGGGHSDFLDGGSGNDILLGKSGDDTLRGDDGNDSLGGGNGNNILSGGNGNDLFISLLDSSDNITGGAGDDTLVLVGKEADYTFTFTKTDIGWSITLKSNTSIVKIVSEIERFLYRNTNLEAMTLIEPNATANQRGRIIDGYIAGGQVFFDGNSNGVLDDKEPFTTTQMDGTFDLDVDIEQFDTNQDTELDHTEGQFVVTGGVDMSTGLPMATPLSSVLDSTFVTPLTTIIANLVQQGTDPKTAQTQVQAALGLPAGVELGSYDPLEAISNGDTKGVSVFGSMIQVQNTIVQMAKFIDGVSETPLAQLAYSGIGAIGNQLKGGAAVDLGKTETILAILQAAITKAAQSDPKINPTQLAASAAAAAQIMALGNQMVKDLVASGRPATDIATGITKLQAVSVGQIAVGLVELAAGTVTVEQFLAQNTKEAILARMDKVKVNDPTVRPTAETIDSNGQLVLLEPSSSKIGTETDTETLTAIAPTPSATASETPTPSATASETPTPSKTPTLTSTTNNISNDDCICDRITYPKFNQPNAVENTIIGGAAIQIGTAKNDKFSGSNSGNIFDGQSGDDNLYGGAGNDIFNGNQGNDFITGGKGDDILYGDEGNDIILGESGNDLIHGGKGNDLLHGREGTDIIYGNKDDDFIDGGKDNDTLYGGKGNDIMLGSQGDDNLFGQDGNDTICGGEGNDLINGDAGADILGGCAGNDTLFGGADNDTLTGGKGDDLLDGGMGNDSLIGGSGNDIFVLKAGQGFDTIADFTIGQDLIGLTGGLSFGQLEMTQNTQGTLIKNLLTGEQLGVLAGVNANAITATNFLLV